MSQTDTYTVAIGKISTTLTCLTPPPPTASVGDHFDFHVQLKDASGPIPGKPVTFYVNGSAQATDDTNSDGKCLFEETFVAPGTVDLQAKFDGDDTYEGC